MKITKQGKVILGILLFGGFFAAKIMWWDKRPHDVQASMSYGVVSVPDAPESSLTGNAAVKLEFPTKTVSTSGTTQINWYIMAWQSQNSIVYANGGKQTTKGSLFEKANLNVSLIRQDDCPTSCANLVKFCKDYKDNPSTPAVFITFMGSGIPAYAKGISDAVKDLPPDYQPVAFISTGKSFGEDQVFGDIKYKLNPQNLKGAVLCGYMLDGDNDCGIKFSNDNAVKCNTDGMTFDYDALNFMYPKDFLDAVVKYNAGYTETRHIVKNGKSTGRDTVVAATLVATWTPGDVNAFNGKGGVTIISTKEYSSIMPNITLTCRKWLNDHRTDAENILINCAVAGDQIRSYEDAKKYAASLNVQVYGEQTADYWYNLYNGINNKTPQAVLAKLGINKSIDENTHLGGSMVYNLADMANLFGLSDNNHVDIYKAVYNTFGSLQSKYYPKELPTYLEYSKIFDRSILVSVIANHPELLEGKINAVDYTKTTTKIGNKSYQIQFETGSATIKEESFNVLDKILDDVTAADGTKIKIVGFTDNTGNEDNNLILSKNRAESVKKYMLKKGLPAVRLESDGQGSENPIGANNTPDGRKQNRRVEINLYGI